MPYDVQLENGDLPVRTEHISGIELVAQRVRIRLGTHRREWLFNPRVGLPFMRWRAQKPPPLGRIEARVRRTVRDTPGVREVRGVSAELDGRTVRVTGRIIAEEFDEPIEMEAVLLDEEGNNSPSVAMKLAESRTVL